MPFVSPVGSTRGMGGGRGGGPRVRYRMEASARTDATSAQRCAPVLLVLALCCLLFELGAWQMGGIRGDDVGRMVYNLSKCATGLFPMRPPPPFPRCPARCAHITPGHPPNLGGRRCRCLVPPPQRYVTPFSWPRSRDHVPCANVPSLPRAVAHLAVRQGPVFSFLREANVSSYVDELASIVPIADGTVRTALDIGCGVASWAAYLLDRNVLAMSLAPRDLLHDSQVQFALERGVPAVIGMLRTIKLPYPSGSFDMIHCSNCLVPWTSNDGIYLMEADRVLRPGGYWILSGPPINWKAWNGSKENLRKELSRIEDFAQLLCWEKVSEKGDVAVWRKKVNAAPYIKGNENSSSSVRTCASWKANDVWHKSMTNGMAPPKVCDPDEIAVGQVKRFPDRLFAVPPSISSGHIPGISEESYHYDNKLWNKHVSSYKKINNLIGTVRYRNMMDMNAGFGGFASAIQSENSWVMNVVPTISSKDTLGIIYDRGLIGIYHDWCEAFSTFPRTYDFIHASGVFSLYKDRCKMEDILLEMDRILRPEGAVILRDDVEVISKVMRIVWRMQWNVKLFDHEDGPIVPEKIVIAVKRWVRS